MPRSHINMSKQDKLRTVVRLLIVSSILLLIMAGPIFGDEEVAKKPIGFWGVLLLPKIWVGAIFCLAGALLLAKAKATRNVRHMFLPVIFFAFGVLTVLPLGQFAAGMGLHPSPVCTLTKPFLFINAGRSVPIVFFAVLAAVTVFSVAGNKLFCGWVCPGAGCQEAMFQVNDRRISRGGFIKWMIWIPWIGIIATLVIRRGGYERADFFYETFYGLSISNIQGLISYLMVLLVLIVLPALAVGRRSFCHHLCWIAPFMILGRKIRNTVKWHVCYWWRVIRNIDVKCS